MLASVKVKVPATCANCGPGFDSVGLACTLYNTFSISLIDEPKIFLEAKGEGEGLLRPSERNFAVKSVRRVLNEAGSQKQGMKIIMENNIPMSRGLGSSSAAIVGAMIATNALLDNVFDRETIFKMATEFEGHPDNVAPAIYGGLTVSFMDDKHTPHFIRVEPPKDMKMIAVVPDFTLSTKVAREALPKTVSYQDATFNVSRVALLIASMCSNDLSYLPFALEDKLHQPYRSKLIPHIDQVFAEAKKAGALGSIISGSGSTLMAFARKDANAVEIGRKMCKVFKDNGKNARYHLLDFDTQGARIVE